MAVTAMQSADQHIFVALMNLFLFFYFIQLEMILVSSYRELLQFCVVEVTSHQKISWQKLFWAT